MICGKPYTYLLLATAPVHVDSGESQLGGVDNTIIRDPSDGIPKIPGTSLHGVIRHNAALYAATHIDRKYLQCAGQIQPDSEHDVKCPICWTFGRPPNENDHETGHVGRVSIYDALIFFFPVNTMYGLAYITTTRLVNKMGIKTQEMIPLDLAFPIAYRTGIEENRLPVNLGLMMFYKSHIRDCRLKENTCPTMPSMDDAFRHLLYNNLYIVDETSFTRIVNGNLDVRTSVPIVPETGIAKSTGPFMVESIPRGTILGFDLVPSCDDFPRDFEGNNLFPDRWTSILDVVETGILLVEVKGVGGLSTRGMGRLKWIDKLGIQEMGA